MAKIKCVFRKHYIYRIEYFKISMLLFIEMICNDLKWNDSGNIL